MGTLEKRIDSHRKQTSDAFALFLDSQIILNKPLEEGTIGLAVSLKVNELIKKGHMTNALMQRTRGLVLGHNIKWMYNSEESSEGLAVDLLRDLKAAT